MTPSIRRQSAGVRLDNIAFLKLMKVCRIIPKVNYLTETGVFTTALASLQRLKYSFSSLPFAVSILGPRGGRSFSKNGEFLRRKHPLIYRDSSFGLRNGH